MRLLQLILADSPSKIARIYEYFWTFPWVFSFIFVHLIMLVPSLSHPFKSGFDVGHCKFFFLFIFGSLTHFNTFGSHFDGRCSFEIPPLVTLTHSNSHTHSYVQRRKFLSTLLWVPLFLLGVCPLFLTLTYSVSLALRKASS